MPFKGTGNKIKALVISVMASFICCAADANDDWWFDVEVIVFKRDISLSQLDEQFQLADSLSPYTDTEDLISARLQPDIAWLKQGLETCDAPPFPRWPEFSSLPEPEKEDDTTSVSDSTAEQNTDGIIPSDGTLLSDTEAEQPFVAENAAPTSEGLLPSSEDELLSSDTQLISDPVSDVIDTLENLPEPLVFPDEQQIADYWLDAFWLPRNADGVREYQSPVTVSPIKTCRTETPWLTFENNQWIQNTPYHYIPLPEYLAVVQEGVDWKRHPRAHLLSSESFELESLSRRIRQQRALTRLLHTTWRQPVAFGEDNAFKVRLFGGHDLGLQFNLDGQPHPEPPPMVIELPLIGQESDASTRLNNGELIGIQELTIFDRINDRLTSPTPVSLNALMHGSNNSDIEGETDNGYSYKRPDAIWEVDGYLKVFLKYINSVPYLHIDSEVSLRIPQSSQVNAPDAETESLATLVSIPFSEQRRVISKQLHYFDHPLFGMVVEIRRYRRPAEPEHSHE